jgi:hypothetical protein
MALTPADSRPWISGTSDNSIWSLVVGWPRRLDGQAGGGRHGRGARGGGGNSLFGGSAGVFRLFGDNSAARPAGSSGSLVGGIGLVVARGCVAAGGWLIAVGGSS